MTMFDAEVGGRPLSVSVERTGHLLRVSAGGRACLVDACRVGERSWSLLVTPDTGSEKVSSSDRRGPSASCWSIDATVADGPEPGAFDVHIAGGVVAVRLRPARARAGPSAGARPARGDGPQRVVAPMPGKIVRVLVGPGDEVAPGQGLIVVEAMKMENELRAARAGRVAQVAVAEGQSVEAGALLLVVG